MLQDQIDVGEVIHGLVRDFGCLQEVLERLQKYREASVFRQVESLLRESSKSPEINTDLSLKNCAESQDPAPL